MIGLVAVSPAGRPVAEELHAAWPDASTVYKALIGACFGPMEAFGLALDRCRQVVVVAPVTTAVGLLGEQAVQERPTGKAVVCVDPQRRWAVPLTSGSDELVREVAAVLGAVPVLLPRAAAPGHPLDVLPGHAVQATRGPGGAAARAAVRDGRPVRLEADLPHPLPALPPSVRADAPADAPVLRITDRTYPDEDVLLVHPRSLVVGIGAGSSAEQTEAMRLIMDVLATERLARSSVARLATVEGKADHPAVRWAAFCLSVPVVELPAAELAGVRVPNPSAGVRDAVGTASVAEAAAVLAAGGGELLVPKRKSAATTVAFARTAVRGRLAVVGLGPGDRDLLVPRALAELRSASAVVGTAEAVESVAELLRPGTRRVEGAVAEACALAEQGLAVCLVATGDGTLYHPPAGRYELLRVPGLPRIGEP